MGKRTIFDELLSNLICFIFMSPHYNPDSYCFSKHLRIAGETHESDRNA